MTDGRAQAALAVRGVHKRYGSVAALRGVDLEVGERRAGRAARPERRRQVDAGEDRLRARRARPPGRRTSAAQPPGSPEAQRALGYLAELFRFPDWCTRRRAARAPPAARGVGRRRGRAARAARARRPRRRAPTARIGTMSKGMQQRLGIAQALIGARGCCCSTSRRARSTRPGGATVRALLEDLRERGVARAAELAPAVRGRARLRPRGDHRPRRGRRRRARRPSSAAPGGVEVETARRPRVFPEATPRRRAADRARAGRRRRGRLRRRASLTSTLEDAYLEAVGRAEASGGSTRDGRAGAR